MVKNTLGFVVSASAAPAALLAKVEVLEVAFAYELLDAAPGVGNDDVDMANAVKGLLAAAPQALVTAFPVGHAVCAVDK